MLCSHAFIPRRTRSHTRMTMDTPPSCLLDSFCWSTAGQGDKGRRRGPVRVGFLSPKEAWSGRLKGVSKYQLRDGPLGYDERWFSNQVSDPENDFSQCRRGPIMAHSRIPDPVSREETDVRGRLRTDASRARNKGPTSEHGERRQDDSSICPWPSAVQSAFPLESIRLPFASTPPAPSSSYPARLRSFGGAFDQPNGSGGHDFEDECTDIRFRRFEGELLKPDVESSDWANTASDQHEILHTSERLEWQPDPDSLGRDEADEVWKAMERRLGRPVRDFTRRERGRWVLVKQKSGVITGYETPEESDTFHTALDSETANETGPQKVIATSGSHQPFPEDASGPLSTTRSRRSLQREERVRPIRSSHHRHASSIRRLDPLIVQALGRLDPDFDTPSLTLALSTPLVHAVPLRSTMKQSLCAESGLGLGLAMRSDSVYRLASC
ncbi:hypothetical protein BD324DRAFT_630592 [Kockovaella imperatae]|uniref:Uncharacterized protein n=1 Tax=Kockovaella imperatae TaxID=4999 RepID=A0A1Y1UBX2_9TREE|nr:hypothetical protein BD324DRAFT_630592 [Kockovaella imperatae]ORX35541.1 hypothetical protein BD324DRAFT_630592 [Kockovaella imperatae]